MAYDANNRLTHETIDEPSVGVTTTAYAYDAANNRTTKQVSGGTEPGQWTYAYNAANQLTSWQKQLNGSPAKSAALTYDAAGNRIAQTVSENGNAQSTLYAWDAQDRLSSVTMHDGSEHAYAYDYRTRRLSTTRSGGILPPSSTAIVFAGGLSLAEYDVSASPSSSIENPASSIVQYVRGPDMGGGVGGMLYSLRGGTTKYSLSNGRGDIVAQADQGASLTWTASYEAYGKRTKETGTNQDKQRANSKDEDPTGLLNEGFRYRDIETGVWLSRDPAGFVDGPNLYAYVMCNPWTAFDPEGLATILTDDEVVPKPKSSPQQTKHSSTILNGGGGAKPDSKFRQLAEEVTRGNKSAGDKFMKEADEQDAVEATAKRDRKILSEDDPAMKYFADQEVRRVAPFEPDPSVGYAINGLCIGLMALDALDGPTPDASLAIPGVRALGSRAAPRLALPASRGVNEWQGPIQSIVTDGETLMYRVHGGGAEQMGAWLTPFKPTSVAAARSSLALPEANAATHFSEVWVPTGTRLQVGTAAPAFGQSGGGIQVQLLERIPANSFGTPTPFK